MLTLGCFVILIALDGELGCFRFSLFLEAVLYHYDFSLRTTFPASYRFWKIVFYFYFWDICWLPLWLLHWLIGFFLVTCYFVASSLCFFQVSSCDLMSCFILLWLVKMLDFSHLKFIETCFMAIKWSILENVPWHLKCMCFFCSFLKLFLLDYS